MNMVRARLSEKSVDEGKIEVIFQGFELLPVDGHLHGVRMHGGDGRPNFRQQGGPSAGIVYLSAQDQIRLAID